MAPGTMLRESIRFGDAGLVVSILHGEVSMFSGYREPLKSE
jgi:hypothetical protein